MGSCPSNRSRVQSNPQFSILKGLRLNAQGCERMRATLGKRRESFFNRNGDLCKSLLGVGAPASGPGAFSEIYLLRAGPGGRRSTFAEISNAVAATGGFARAGRTQRR